MGIKILRLRHRFTPEVNGCRWCGVSEQEHAQQWTPAARWHAFVQPTDAQRLARVRSRRTPRVPTIITNVASYIHKNYESED